MRKTRGSVLGATTSVCLHLPSALALFTKDLRSELIGGRTAVFVCEREVTRLASLGMFVWSALSDVHLVDFLDVSAERVRRSLRALY